MGTEGELGEVQSETSNDRQDKEGMRKRESYMRKGR